jgi:hypothetical protein
MCVRTALATLLNLALIFVFASHFEHVFPLIQVYKTAF